MSRVVVLVIDGLGSKYLGPYGNTWIETQAFNQLAADSLLLDGIYAPYTDALKTVNAIWGGDSKPEHGSLTATPGASEQPSEKRNDSFMQQLSTRGVRSKLFTDDADLLDSKLAAHFDEQVEIQADAGLKLASEWDETHAARFFAQAIDALTQLKQDELLWIQSRGLGNPWDAPFAFREQFAEEDDPEPSGSSQVPSLKLDADYDPDTLHDMQCALAGQVALLDQCMGVLMSVLQTDASDVMFMLTSPRGFPLGEHRSVGWGAPSSHHELLSVPGIVRFPQRRYALRRYRGILESTDLTQLLLDWYADAESKPSILQNEFAEQRSYSISRGENDIALRTPVWHLRFADFGTEKANTELYLWPDDQNEVNDVAGRCADVVEAGSEFLQTLLDGSTPSEVPEILRESRE